MELIVVIVILAILAAILVPALLGYIDRAKDAKYVELGHTAEVAAKAAYVKAYVNGDRLAITKITKAGTSKMQLQNLGTYDSSNKLKWRGKMILHCRIIMNLLIHLMAEI